MPTRGETKWAGVLLRSLVALLLPLSLMLSGCMIRFSIETRVDEDESGTFAIFVGFDEEFRQLVEQSAGDTSELLMDTPAGWSSEEVVEDGFEGSRISTEFDTLEELEQQLAALGADQDVEIGTPVLEGFSLDHDRNEFRFELDASGVGDELSNAMGESLGDDMMSGTDREALLRDLFDIQYLLTLPGTLESHNAEAVEDNTLLWTVRFDDERSTYRATSIVGSFLLRYVEEVELRVEIADDESGSLTLVVGLSDAVEALVDSGNEVATSLVEEVPSSWGVVDLGENGLAGLSFSTDFSSIDRAERLLTRLGEATGLDDATGLVSNFELARDGSDYRFQAEVAHGDEAVTLDAAGTATSLVLILPGKIGDHNADEIDGEALVWDLDAAAVGAPLDAESSTGGTSALLLAVIGLAVVAGIGGLTVLLRRQTTKAPPTVKAVQSQSFCRSCGKELPAAGRFCPACGEPLAG
jgi:hypothetical protein